MSKLQKHYILLFLAIIMIVFGFIFFFYTKDESYTLLAIIGVYLLGYTWLWLHTYYHWSGKINKSVINNNIQKTTGEKTFYSTNKFILNFVIFIAIFLFLVILFAYFIKIFGIYTYYIYFVLIYSSMSKFLAISFCKFYYQERYVSEQKMILSKLLIGGVYAAIILFLAYKYPSFMDFYINSHS